MAKLADALDLGSSGLSVGVQVPSPAPLANLFELFELWYIEINQNDWFFSFYKKKIIRKVGVYDKYYQKRNKFWNEYTRDEKAELIIKYIEEIELTDKYGNYTDVEFIKFRESIANTSNELYFKGYYDRYVPSLFGNIYGKIRFSEYLPEEEMADNLFINGIMDEKEYISVINKKVKSRDDFER